MAPAFNTLTAIRKGNKPDFDLSIRNKNDYFDFRFTGFIEVQTDGEYTFYTSSDDGKLNSMDNFPMFVSGKLLLLNLKLADIAYQVV